MKKAKLLGLLSAPIALSAIPLCSTSCSNEESIVISDNKDINTPAELDGFKQLIYDNYVKKDIQPWTNLDGDYRSSSIYNQGLIDKFKANFSTAILRKACLWTMQTNFCNVITDLYAAEFPVNCKYTINFKYDTSAKTFTGLSIFEFSTSNKVHYSTSTYIPSPVALSAVYDVENDTPDTVTGKIHHNAIFTTTDGKETIQHVTSLTDQYGVETTSNQYISSIDLLTGIFFDGTGESYKGPILTNEIIRLGTTKPAKTTSSLAIIDLAQVNANLVDWKKGDVGGTTNPEDWYFKIQPTTLTKDARLTMDQDGRTILKKATDVEWPNNLVVIAFNKKSGSFIVSPSIVLY